jgi:K+-transporting ATPase ATPase C chain
MRRQLVTGLRVTIALVVLLGFVYPAAVWVIGRVAFKDKANGSCVKVNGKTVGSSLIGQSFSDKGGNPLPNYFQPRPSAAGGGYDATASSATNLGPLNPKLIAPASGPDCYLVAKTDDKGNPVLGPDGKPEQQCYADTVPGRVAAYREFNGLRANAKVPVDAVTASGSGLDPDISEANALVQAPRVANARGLSPATVTALVRAHVSERQLGFLGEKTVNVLDLNIALDRLHPSG